MFFSIPVVKKFFCSRLDYLRVRSALASRGFCVRYLQLFLQLKGDMVLQVVERNQHRDVVIKEGEVYRNLSTWPSSSLCP